MVRKKRNVMKIFLCWSKPRGKELAKAMKDWLANILPNLTPQDIFFAPEIEKGSEWFDAVRQRLTEVDAALICLTPESLHSPWIHFEAGAVLGRLERTRVFPFLFDVRPEDVEGPLSAFQGTSNTEEDTLRLARDLRRLAQVQPEEPPDYATAFWAKLKGEMDKLKIDRISQVVPNFRKLFQRKTFEEKLSDCTHQTWVDRHSAARETWKTLQGHKITVDQTCEPYQKELFQQLINAVDGYAGLLKSSLIEEKRYWISEAGTVDFNRASDGTPATGAVAGASERRVQQIQRLVFLLDSPSAMAVTPEASDFSRMTVFAQRKELVRAKQQAIRSGGLLLSEIPKLSGRESIWELDRIVYYLLLEESKAPVAKTLAECIEGELERLKAVEEYTSAMPLHYAIRALLSPKLVRDEPALDALLTDVEQYLNNSGHDKGRQIRRNIEKFRQASPARTGHTT